MKLLFLILFNIFFSSSAFAQNVNQQVMQKDDPKDSKILQLKIDSLKSEVEYIRKINDTAYQKKVFSEVEKQSFRLLQTWGAWIGGFLTVFSAIFGYLGVKIGAEKIRVFVRERVKEMAEDEYRKINKKQNTFIIKQRFESIERNYRKFEEEDDAVKQINEILDEMIAINDKLLIEEMLGKIVCYYYDCQYYKAISNLAYEYGDKYNFDEVTWTNVALSNLNMYKWYGGVEYRNQTVDACNKSLKKNPIYEEPLAVLIIVYCIQIQHETDVKISENVISELRKLINNVNSGTSEFVSYTVLDKLNQRGKDYLPLIKKEINTEYSLLITRAEKYSQISKLPPIKISDEADIVPLVAETDKTVPPTT